MLQVLVNVSLEKFSITEEEAWAMQELFKKEKEKKVLRKRTSV